MNGKWKYAMIPSLLVHCSVGIIYCWSLLYRYISIVFDDSNISWAFSLAVFLLGLSAATLGPFLDRDSKKTGLSAAGLFGLGFIFSGLALWTENLWMFFLGFGGLAGIGIGLAYICPMKIVMSWFNDTGRRGLAIGLVITSFGLGKLFYSPLIILGAETIGISWTLVGIGLLGMLIIGWSALWMRSKPGLENPKKGTKMKTPVEWFKNIRANFLLPGFMTLWMILFLNTTIGLAIISYESYFFLASGVGILAGAIMSGASNTLGRFCIGWWSDTFFVREKMLGLILCASGIFCFLSFLYPVMIPVAIVVCNFGFGAMFSIIPNILADRYGLEKVVETHGLILSAWALAGLVGNQMTNMVIGLYSSANQTVMLVNAAVYLIALSMSTKFWEEEKEKKES